MALVGANAVFAQGLDSPVTRVMDPPAADLILNNGQIYTPGGWASSVAIGRGMILAVGDAQAVKPHQTPRTRVVDLHGDTVFPGLNDAHVHVMWGGADLIKCKFQPSATIEQIRAAVKACTAKRAKGQWIVGGDWAAETFKDSPAQKSVLDAVAPNNPVVLSKQTDFASPPVVWVNSQALRAAKITAQTPDPANGRIERDATGEPTGVLHGAAARLVNDLVPAATHADRVAAVQAGIDAMLSYGVTSFNDALSEEEDMTIYASLADAGKLKQRVKICIRWDGGAANAAAEALIRNRGQFARQRINTDCVKLYTDGAPMVRTARMLEPYVGDPHNTGKWTIPPDQLKQLVQRFDAQGLTLKIHATGDESARSALDAIAAARRANGWSAGMHEVAHNSFVAEADLQRGRTIGATFEFSPYIWYPTPLEDIATRMTVGDVRMERVHPVRDAIDAGALVVGGSDWPFAASVSPWLGIETLVTRRTPGGGDRAVGGQEAITLREAIDMFTVNAATALGVRDKFGAIEAGLVADMVVLDRNPLKIPITEVHETRAKRVFIAGEQVYDAGS